MMQTSRRAILGVMALAFLAGCAQPAADPYAHHFGDAYWANRNATIENPNAGSQDPVTGLDGQTTEGVMETYREHQRDQVPVYEEDESIVGSSEMLSH